MKRALTQAGLAVVITAIMGIAQASDSATTKHGKSAEKSIEQLTTTCAACHGATGVSPSGAFPTIAGQHPSYIAKALEDYQSGERKNPIMAGQVASLSKADIKALAAFFSAQEGPLYTPAKD